MTLIDTSSWIEALRKSGDPEIRNRVKRLMLKQDAAWCAMVQVELWNGARGGYEKKQLARLEEGIHCLPITDEVWILARKLARQCRDLGLTVPATDLIIVACACHNNVPIDHSDSHIDMIMTTVGLNHRTK